MVNVGMLQGYEVSVIVIIQSNLPKATTPKMAIEDGGAMRVL